ncbi:MAG: hypothetical protein OCD02_01150 [Spirochaetaceae bacterium]
MGIFVNLYVNFDSGVTQEEWSRVYEESKLVLKNFPVDLIRLTLDNVAGHERYVLSKQICENIGTDDENWQISGDLKSLKQAETFELYKFEVNKHCFTNNSKDVLFANEDDLVYVDCNGTQILGGKTQGYPYHLAILSVAILIENRLGDKAFVLGDITTSECRAVVNWMNGFLKKTVQMPLTMDGQKLWDRIYPLYDNIDSVINRFKVLSREDNITQSEIIYKNTNNNDFEENLKTQIVNYKSITQIGASRIIEEALVVLKDVRRVIEIFVLSKSEVFKLDELLELLCSKFITIPIEKRSSLLNFSVNSNKLNTVEDQLSSIISMFNRKPSDINYFIEQVELIEAFSSFDPGEKDTYRDIVNKWHKKNEEILNNLNGTIIDEHQDHMDIISSDLPDDDQNYKNTEIFATSMEQMSEEHSEYLKETFDPLSSNDKILKIIDLCHRSIALSEEAWVNIDHETDFKVLKALFVLVSIDNNELVFSRWRRHFLETKELWSILASKF